MLINHLRANEWVAVCWHFFQDYLPGTEPTATLERIESYWSVDRLEGTKREKKTWVRSTFMNSVYSTWAVLKGNTVTQTYLFVVFHQPRPNALEHVERFGRFEKLNVRTTVLFRTQGQHRNVMCGSTRRKINRRNCRNLRVKLSEALFAVAGERHKQQQQKRR